MNPDQAPYQVRFDWGMEGVRSVGSDADVLIVVDVLSFTTAVELALTAGSAVPAIGPGEPSAGAKLCAQLVDHPAAVVAASLRNRMAVAQWVLARQAEKGDRWRVAVIAAGDERSDGLRFAVEDLLGAGAVIDALATVGIDYCSPEAAVATAAFGALQRATGHLISASVSGQEALARDARVEIDLASDIDSSATVPVLTGSVFSRDTSSH